MWGTRDGGHVLCLRFGQFERSGVDGGVVDEDVDRFGDLFGLLDGLLPDIYNGVTNQRNCTSNRKTHIPGPSSVSSNARLLHFARADTHLDLLVISRVQLDDLDVVLLQRLDG
jgi:hypothetical protein